MSRGYAQTRSYRDFFRIHAPLAAVDRAVDSAPPFARSNRGLVLNIDTGAETPGEMRIELDTLPVIPFAAATRGLVSLAMDPAAYGDDQGVDLFLPRSAFDRVADHYGAARIASLSLPVGAAREDVVLAHLASCLERALEPSSASSTATIDQVSLALNLHLAQRYGGLKPPRTPERGGWRHGSCGWPGTPSTGTLMAVCRWIPSPMPAGCRQAIFRARSAAAPAWPRTAG